MKKAGLFFLILSMTALPALFFLSCKGTAPPVEEPSPPPSAPKSEPPASPPPPAEPDTTGPEVDVRFSTRYFSPDDDGVEDELHASINVKDESPLAGWRIEIREPNSDLLFSEWSGEGPPPAEIIWDGRSVKGELVQSASDYPFTLSVTDEPGNTTTYEGIIEVDVLVIREPEDVLRIQIPSIIFASNSGNFQGLAPEIMQNNDWILRRLADVLNKFSSYRIKVEGHANYTAATPAGRRLEQIRELQPLSQKRAETVVNYLVYLGISRNRLTPVGIGGSRPVVNFNDRQNWWKNRRVEFILEK